MTERGREAPLHTPREGRASARKARRGEGQCIERECLDVRQGDCLKSKLMLREESKALGRAWINTHIEALPTTQSDQTPANMYK